MRLTVDLDGPVARILVPTLRYYLPIALAVVGTYLAVISGPPFVWLLLAPLVLLAAFAADNIIGDRLHDAYPTRRSRWRFWILPGALVIASTLFFFVIVDRTLAPVAALVTLALLALGIWAESHASATDEPNVTLHHLILSLVAYSTTFLLFSAVFDAPVGPWGQAILIGICSFVLAIEIYRQGQADVAASILHAVVTALLLSQVALALDYWPLSGMLGGIFLLLVFYAVTGIGQSYFSGRLSRQTVIEFVAVMALGFLLLFIARSWIV